MGAIRGTLSVFLTSIFFTLVLLSGVMISVSYSLQYDSLKSNFIPLMSNLLMSNLNLNSTISTVYPLMREYCLVNTNYTFSYSNFTINLPCTVINEGTDSIVNYALEQVLRTIYYQNYNCKFFDCFGQGSIPLFLISDHTRAYLMARFYLFLSATILVVILMFLFFEKRANVFISAGAAAILASIVILKLPSFSFFLPGQFSQIGKVFFSASYGVFSKMIIIGIISLILGIVFRFVGIEEKIFGKKEEGERREENNRK